MTFGAALRAWFATLERPTYPQHMAVATLEKALGSRALESVRLDELRAIAASGDKGRALAILGAARDLGFAPRVTRITRERDRLAPGGLTYDEVGARLGLSRSRVKEIEDGALRKLRRALEAQGNDMADFLPDDRDGRTWSQIA